MANPENTNSGTSTIRATLPVGARVGVVSRCSWTLYNFRIGLLRQIVAERGEVVAFGACDDGFDNELRGAGIEVRHVPVSRTGIDPINDLRLLDALVRQFRRMRPHVVHAFTVKPVVYATLAARFTRVPVRIVTITGLGHAFTSASSPVRWTVSLLYKLALAHADIVFFQNNDDRQLFIERRLVDQRKTRLVAGSGVNLNIFRLEPLPSQRGAAPCFLMVSRLLKEKGVVDYLAAAAQLKERYPEVRIQLVGAVDPRNPSSIGASQLEALRRSQCVEWIDEVQDVRPVISRADVIVLPSYREGLPRSLLEGGAMGRALIATDVPGCREVVRNGWNGYLVPVADPHALAEAMKKFVLRPPDIGLFGARARQMIAERFDENAVIGETLGVYADLLRRKVGEGALGDVSAVS